jgi:pyruvate dehydrogenase (quinone)
MNELITIKKYMEEWVNPQFIIVVLHNNDLAQVSWEMRTEDANPVWSTSQDVQSMDYAGWAELLGFTGIRVKSDSEVGEAFDQAFSTQGVTLIDKNVPPLPPHISKTFALNTLKALLKGDPDAKNVVRDSAEALISEGIERVKGVFHLNDQNDPAKD